MKASELIKHLEKLMEEHGDLEVTRLWICGNQVQVRSMNINSKQWEKTNE